LKNIFVTLYRTFISSQYC